MTQALEPILRDNLLTVARRFAEARRIKLTTVSRLAHGDDPFFDRLAKKQGSFTARKYDEVMQKFRELWPEGIEFPPIKEPFPTLPVPVPENPRRGLRRHRSA